MTKKAVFFSVITIVVILFYGCYYDKAELVYPSCNLATTDTTNVRYSVDIVKIMQANCNSCHGGTASNGGGYRLDNYSGLSGMANNGRLLPAVNHTGRYPMPKGGAKLSECDIARIRVWVRNGAPNN